MQIFEQPQESGTGCCKCECSIFFRQGSGGVGYLSQHQQQQQHRASISFQWLKKAKCPHMINIINSQFLWPLHSQSLGLETGGGGGGERNYPSINVGLLHLNSKPQYNSIHTVRCGTSFTTTAHTHKLQYFGFALANTPPPNTCILKLQSSDCHFTNKTLLTPPSHYKAP